MSNSVDPDGTVLYEPSRLDLHCLQKPVIIACGSVRVNSEESLLCLILWTNKVTINRYEKKPAHDELRTL